MPKKRTKKSDLVWEKRVELKRPLAERLSNVFYLPLKRPARSMAKFFKGMDVDLDKANLRVAPERYASLVIGVSLIVGIFAFVLAMLVLPLLPALVVGVSSFMFAFVFSRSYPKGRAKSRVAEVNREIPYALRHMATHLSAGIGLPETMTSISRADYGALSEEFDRVIRDMQMGMSAEEALATMNERVDSKPLRRAVRQIQRTLRTGGDLSGILNSLAEETAFEMHIKLREYTQSLNMLTMIYMFASAVIPAMLITMMSVTSSMGGAMFTTSTAGVFFLGLLPVLLLCFVMLIKRLEPRL